MPIIRLHELEESQDRITGELEVPGDRITTWRITSLVRCPWRPCILGAASAPNGDDGFLVYDVSEGFVGSLGFHKTGTSSIHGVDTCNETKGIVVGASNKIKIWDLREMRHLAFHHVSSFEMPGSTWRSQLVTCLKVVSEERAIYTMQNHGMLSKLDMRRLDGVVWSKKFHCRVPGSIAEESRIQRFDEGVFISSVNSSITKWTREGDELQTIGLKNLRQCVCLAEWRLKHFARIPKIKSAKKERGEGDAEQEGEQGESVVSLDLSHNDGEKDARWEFLLEEARNETSPLFDLHYLAGDFHFSVWKWIVSADVRPKDGDVVRLHGTDYLWAFTESRADADELVLPFLRMLIDAEDCEASFRDEQILDLFILACGLQLWRRAFFFLSLVEKIEDTLVVLQFVERLTRAEGRCPALEAFYEECIDVLSHLSLPEILRTGDEHKFLGRLQALGIDQELQSHYRRDIRLPPFDDPRLSEPLSSSLRETILDDLYSLFHGEEGKRNADVTLVTPQNDKRPAHLAVLVATTGFFYRMVHFGGSELTSFRENATIRVQIETKALNSLLEWIYTDR